jgi:hypothetical protein
MTRKSILQIALATLAIGGIAGAAQADRDVRCTNEPFERWMSIEQAAAKAAELGYKVHSIEADDGCWEIEGRDAKGVKWEIRLHPVTGEIVQVEEDR